MEPVSAAASPMTDSVTSPESSSSSDSEPCTIPVRPCVPTSRDPLEMFSHFFDHSLLLQIVVEANRHAAQCLATTSSQATWETSVEELKTYLGFMIVMGINRLPEVRDYWATNAMLHNSLIASRIT